MTLTAWEAIGFDGDGLLRIKGGRALYEAAIFYDGTRQRCVKLARLEPGDGGLRQVNRYVDPDTELEVVECR